MILYEILGEQCSISVPTVKRVLKQVKVKKRFND